MRTPTRPTTRIRTFADRWLVAALGTALLLAGCARLPEIATTPLKPETLGRLQEHLLQHSPDVDQFRLRGPFEVTVREDVEIALTPSERIVGDLYLSAAKERAPLVILLHGHENSKDHHAYQAYHLATWGLHSFALDLPNEGPWIDNGKTFARLVNYVRRTPAALDARIDPERILVAGHSFGAVAAAVALAEGAPAAGAILLDPASQYRELPGYLRRVRRPVLILSADARVGMTQNRDDFFYFIPANVFEVSVAGAHHEDAEFPYDTGLGLFDDSHANRPHQITFASALTSAAFSIAFTGKLDYAWTSFDHAVKEGKLFDRMRK